MFTDRKDGGRRLIPRLEHLKDEDPIVIGLPRGGVPVAREVARALEAPLDVVVVRKIGAPSQPELALGAAGPGGETVLDDRLMGIMGIMPEDLDRLVAKAREEIHDRERRLRTKEHPLQVKGRTVIVVDDGVATGSTAMAALRVLRKMDPKKLVLAVPVIAGASVSRFEGLCDELVYVDAPDPFMAVGYWYRQFGQTSDEEVREILEEYHPHEEEPPAPAPSNPGPGNQPTQTTHTQETEIPAGDNRLAARISIPPEPKGVVLFAHGTGSGKDSPRNTQVARILNEQGLATVLIDLLTPQEHEQQERGPGPTVEDFHDLAERLAAASRWVITQPELRDQRVGTIGSSTGAAIALLAAAHHEETVDAVVSRGGRPDLAGAAIARVKAPTLFIVGSEDSYVLGLNEDALQELPGEKNLHVVRGASHLFEEPGTLQEAALEAAHWFLQHLHKPTMSAHAT